MKASISALVVLQPTLTRMAHSLSSAGTPIALSTWLGPTLPDEQADPDDTETPFKSRPIIATEFLSPGIAKSSVLPIRSDFSPKTTAFGAKAYKPSTALLRI